MLACSSAPPRLAATQQPTRQRTPPGFVPLNATASAYAGVVLAGVAIEEAVRYGVWRAHL